MIPCRDPHCEYLTGTRYDLHRHTEKAHGMPDTSVEANGALYTSGTLNSTLR